MRQGSEKFRDISVCIIDEASQCVEPEVKKLFQAGACVEGKERLGSPRNTPLKACPMRRDALPTVTKTVQLESIKRMHRLTRTDCSETVKMYRKTETQTVNKRQKAKKQ